MMTSAFVSGLTAQCIQRMKLKQQLAVHVQEIIFFRVSLTVTLSPSWQSFVLQLHKTSWETATFGAIGDHMAPVKLRGLTALISQVS